MTDFSEHPNWRDRLNDKRIDFTDADVVTGFLCGVILCCVVVLALLW